MLSSRACVAVLALGLFAIQIVAVAHGELPPGSTGRALSIELPTPRSWSGAAWNGSHAFIVGGITSWGPNLQGGCCVPLTGTDEILDFDPNGNDGQGTISVAAHMPRAVGHPHVFWVGSMLVVAGGTAFETAGVPTGAVPYFSSLNKDTYAWSPGGKVETLPAPLLFDGEGSVWTGSEIYLFAQGTDFPNQPNVYRMSPTDGIVTPLQLSVNFAGPIVWDGTRALLFRGDAGATLAFHPETSSVETLDWEPLAESVGGAFWDGNATFFTNTYKRDSSDLGNYAPSPRVDRLDSQSGHLAHFAVLPHAEQGGSTVFDGSHCGYVFGGNSGGETSVPPTIYDTIAVIGPASCKAPETAAAQVELPTQTAAPKPVNATSAPPSSLPNPTSTSNSHSANPDGPRSTDAPGMKVSKSTNTTPFVGLLLGLVAVAFARRKK